MKLTKKIKHIKKKEITKQKKKNIWKINVKIFLIHIIHLKINLKKFTAIFFLQKTSI